MSKLVEFTLESGGVVVVEVDDQHVGFVPAGLDPAEIARQATKSLEESIDGALAGAKVVMEKIQGLSPDQATVKLGVKLTAQAGAIITKVGGEANFEVTLTWSKSAKASQSPLSKAKR